MSVAALADRVLLVSPFVGIPASAMLLKIVVRWCRASDRVLGD